jgi:class 3 adenylate cyclase
MKIQQRRRALGLGDHNEWAPSRSLPAIAPATERYLASPISHPKLEVVTGGGVSSISAQPVDRVLCPLDLSAERDRAFAAILFTDVVGSTERAYELGDRGWVDLLESHDAVARTVVQQHRGALVKMTGDGALVTFDRPSEAIYCAIALRESLHSLGLEIRAGLHAAEVEVRETDIAGIGVHIAARVLASSSPGQVWVSAAVPMLVAGSGFVFEDRGQHELRGVPGSWNLYSVRE